MNHDDDALLEIASEALDESALADSPDLDPEDRTVYGMLRYGVIPALRSIAASQLVLARSERALNRESESLKQSIDRLQAIVKQAGGTDA